MEPRTGSFGGVVSTALVWAFVWAIPGGAIEAVDNVAPAAHSFTRAVDMWMQTLGLPGLVGGVLFSVLLLITEGRRRLAELSLPRSGAWGAAAGLVTGALFVWVVYGLAEPWPLAAAALGFATAMGAISGAASPLVFQYVAQRSASATS